MTVVAADSCQTRNSMRRGYSAAPAIEMGRRSRSDCIDMAVGSVRNGRRWTDHNQKRLWAGRDHETARGRSPRQGHDGVCPLNAGHRLASKKTIEAKELEGLAMAVFDSTFLQRSVLEELCKAARVKFRLVLQLVKSCPNHPRGGCHRHRRCDDATVNCSRRSADPSDVIPPAVAFSF